ncbi:hypothetical protein AXG93_961s1050 [Marchantia polymorpha subsp. ruderalis]|uniref:Uncharacterized protein n=1 Tax=Marchantia polymorpha subsp. ruderalis TaxID=1480154 RepID=A0A176VST5_MARPO|nr:hypothetical protein AXG93_961s1050 [Marchantia polymorpha subsp. ruderalis]
MEAEVEGRVKPLPYKVRSVSRESAAQKAAHVLDPDLRTHWSTSTNTKEWLVLELEESCLLSHIRIHNKSVLEWEISIGLRFKLMGIPVPGLEPELQPVVDQVLPHIIAHIRDPHDIYLQLLQDISSRLAAFLPHLEGELAVSNEAMETSIRFFAMLVGPFYPILTVLGGRENDKSGSSGMEADTAKSNQATVFTVSSNFQAPPKRVRSPGLSQQPAGHALALRPDAVLLLLRVAYKDTCLGNVCRKVARILRRLSGSAPSGDNSLSVGESAVASSGSTVTGFDDGSGNSEATAMASFLFDYSSIFGEEFRPYDDDGLEINHLGILDVAAVEEGFLHVLYACASQPVMCRRLADSKSDLIPVLPFIQAMLPALRPLPSLAADADQVDETFWQWQAPTVQRAVTQVVALSSSPSYRPLIDACAGYLSSYSPAHEKAACVLIDLCAGPLAPWLSMVVAKVDLAIELLEDLLGIIQAGQQDTSYARAALVYLMLGLSGNVDDVLSQYKDVKHHVLFLVEMLEPFLIPAISPMKSTIAFGDVSAVLLEKQEQTCALALDLLHTAIKKPAVLPAMEAEWRRGHVTPSVLLSILAPHIPLPPGIDLRRSSGERSSFHASEPVQESNGTVGTETVTKFGTTEDEGTSKGEVSADGITKSDLTEDPSLLFAPVELRSVTLPSVASRFEGTSPDSQKVMNFSSKVDAKLVDLKGSSVESKLVLDPVNAEDYFNLQAEYLQLVKSQERELRAMEFVRFAMELHSRRDASKESHQAAIDALLLAAECHLNPFFMVPSTVYQQQVVRFRKLNDLVHLTDSNNTDRRIQDKDRTGLEVVLWLEEERDKAVLRILLEAAEWDSSVENLFTEGSTDSDYNSETSCGVHIYKEDAQAEDAITLVREHQGLLCAFLIHHQVRDGTVAPEAAVAYGIRRQWALLRRLVLVASGGRSNEYDDELAAPRGWMALSRYAKFYKETGLPLVSDMQQLTSLLLVYSDELSSLRTQFSQFANAMLESVCQLLKAVPSSSIPDLLSWFSEVCSEPFPPSVKGYGLANVKYVIVYLLEVIVVEHMEAIVPELPRMLEVLLSLCSSSYSDVPLLESVLAVLKPIISHATSTVATVEDYSPSLGPGATFESLCFDAMTERLKAVTDGKESESRSTSALLLFLADEKPPARKTATQALFALTAPAFSTPTSTQLGTPVCLESGADNEDVEAENGIPEDEGAVSLLDNQDDPAVLGEVDNETTPEDGQGSVDDGLTSQDLDMKSNFFEETHGQSCRDGVTAEKDDYLLTTTLGATSKWLVKALPLAEKESLSSASIPLIELLCVMLEHSEPEQRLGALQQLGKLIKTDLDYISSRDMIADDFLNRQSQESVTQKSFAHVLVASTWERVTSTAACDPSLGLRKEALELLLKSCLYSSPSDISTIPAKVWNSIELMANAKAGGVFAEAERSICQALLQLREHGEAEKQALRDVLSGKVEKQSSPSNFAPVREAVLEVLARLSAVWSKEDSIAAASEELAKEVKEAEIELELLSQEKSPLKTDGSENLRERGSLGTSGSISGILQGDPKERLKQLKTQIMAEEHAKTYAAIAARREKQRIARRDRQLALEKAAIREIELLQEFDRERAAEAERDIERQRTLEKERAKTREMRHNLELEAERRSQASVILLQHDG